MRVLITGCFDIIHPGHIFILNEGAKIGEVYVIVARDSTIKKIKGKLPTIPENQRLEVIKSLKNVKCATLGNENNDFLRKALSLKPDLIILGPNQKISVEILIKKLVEHDASHIKVKRVEQFYDKFDLSSSSAIKKKIIKDSQMDIK